MQKKNKPKKQRSKVFVYDCRKTKKNFNANSTCDVCFSCPTFMMTILSGQVWFVFSSTHDCSMGSISPTELWIFFSTESTICTEQKGHWKWKYFPNCQHIGRNISKKWKAKIFGRPDNICVNTGSFCACLWVCAFACVQPCMCFTDKMIVSWVQPYCFPNFLILLKLPMLENKSTSSNTTLHKASIRDKHFRYSLMLIKQMMPFPSSDIMRLQHAVLGATPSAALFYPASHPWSFWLPILTVPLFLLHAPCSILIQWLVRRVINKSRIEKTIPILQNMPPPPIPWNTTSWRHKKKLFCDKWEFSKIDLLPSGVFLIPCFNLHKLKVNENPPTDAQARHAVCCFCFLCACMRENKP